MDKAQFENRFSKVESLNNERLKRAYGIMSNDCKKMLELVPILLNYNNPKIPGYVSSDVPYGIDGFKPNFSQKNYLIKHGIDPNLPSHGKYSIYALYAMGSTSSIAQSLSSDLDLWVCISKDVPIEQVNLLANKCKFISAFAKNIGAEINLFVTVEDRFLSGDHGAMDTEDCGSAQSLFLLDEFYRSAIRLCGRRIAWFMISKEEEYSDYKKYLEEFYQQDFVNKDEWFDFGSVAKSSPVEYFGSGLWLVYKGIDHPLKAVLKILLMEAYASEYPNTKLLSIELKQAIYDRKNYSLGLDAYFLMLKKVEQYLIKIKDAKRLDLAKICFYLKVKQATPRSSSNLYLQKRLVFLRRICKVWGWYRSFVASLDNASRWKYATVKQRRHEILSSLLESYKALIRFSLLHNIEYAITSDDAGVLSRKIYAAIDEYPTKILVTHSELSSSLEESTLSFVQASSSSVCRKGWHVFTAPMDSLEILSTKASYIAKNATEAVAWTAFNHLLTKRTRIQVKSRLQSIDGDKIKYLLSDIEQFFGNGDLKVSQLELQKPREIVKAMLVVNFEDDATNDFMITPSDLEIGDSLSCGRQKMCLIGSLELLTLNSWGEINCIPYPQGEVGILQILALIVQPQILKYSKEPQAIFNTLKICSYSNSHRVLIKYDLEATIRGIVSCYSEYESNYVFAVGHNTYEAKVDDDGTVVIHKNSLFRANEDEIMVLSKFGMRPEYALQVPAVVRDHASIGVIQYFFKKDEDSWSIYIVNERNEVKTFTKFKGSRSKLVNAINRYYTQESENSSLQVLNFNLPQYFILSDDQQTVKPFTI
ncbi:MAG: class I adenylate cyclase [Succinivibrio sp.]|nr:class I adenylate cyclase [Succinivibrio sp.]